MTDLESGFIGIGALAEKLAMSKRTIWRIVGRGDLPVTKIGRRTLISIAEVKRWLAGHAPPTPGATMTGISRRFGPR